MTTIQMFTLGVAAFVAWLWTPNVDPNASFMGWLALFCLGYCGVVLFVCPGLARLLRWYDRRGRG